MKQQIKTIAIALLLYWGGVWIPFLGFLIFAGNVHFMQDEMMLFLILYIMGVSLTGIIPVGFIWFKTWEKYQHNPLLLFLLWNLPLWIIISVIFELSFHTFSGHTVGLDESRRILLGVLLLSTLAAWGAYRYANYQQRKQNGVTKPDSNTQVWVQMLNKRRFRH